MRVIGLGYRILAPAVLLGLGLSVTAVAWLFASRPTEAAQFAGVSAPDAEQMSVTLLASPNDVAVVSQAEASAIARRYLNLSIEPLQILSGYAAESPGRPQRSSWIVVFSGGPAVPAGPQEGATTRVMTVDYSAVVVDDVTGEVIKWFQSGHYDP